MAEQTNNLSDALIELIKAQLVEVNTSIGGVIVSYSNGLASVKPTGKKRFPDGDALDFPTIHNVRVCWPSFAGGTAGVKGPIRAGDKCLIVFAQQSISDPDDLRTHDLQDAYVIPCDLGNVGSSGDNSSMTMFFGSAYVKLTEGGQLQINASGGVVVNSPSMTQSGTFTAAAVSTASGVSLGSHVHTGVSSGPNTTGGPV